VPIVIKLFLTYLHNKLECLSVVSIISLVLSFVVLNAFMLSVVMLSVVMLSVVMLSVIMLSVVMLSVVMLSIIMLNIVMLCRGAFLTVVNYYCNIFITLAQSY
jgi:hypothetical protein